MGKAVGQILTIGLAVAVNVVPGIGQAISGAIVGLGGGTFAALGVAQAVVGALSLGATVAGLQAASGLLGLGPNIPKPEAASVAIKTPRPVRVSAYGEMRLYGAYILFENADGKAVDVWAVHDGQLTQIVQFYLNDDKVAVDGSGAVSVVGDSDGRYSVDGESKVSLYWTDGSSPGTALAEVVAKLPSIWTSDHRGDGLVQLAQIARPVAAENFLETFPNGAPMPSMAAKWQKCPDLHASDPTDEAEWTWTENPIRQLAHYMLVRGGVDYATKIAPAIAMWRDAQDVCDEAVTLKAGGTEARYRSCLAHKHTDSHGTVKAGLLSLCDGWMATRSDGAYAIYAGKFETPTVSIGSEHIVSYDWQGVGVDDDSAVNEIVCSYVSTNHDYNSVECDAWRDEDDISERGSILSDVLDMQTPSWGQVRRLAKRKMSRTNAPYRGTITTNIKGRIARGQRYINLTLAEAGSTFFDGVAEITSVTRNMATGGITFSWVAADANIDAWNPATEEGEPAAKGDRVALAPLEAPTINSATPTPYDYGAQILLDVTGPDRDDLTWYTRWKISSDTTWSEQETTDTDAGTPVALITPVVPSGVEIDVQVAYGVGDGRISGWSATETVETTGGVTLDSATTAYVAAMTVKPTTARKLLLNQLVTGLKNDGIWTKLDALYVMASHDAQAGQINLLNPVELLAATNSPTFTTDRGYNGNGSSSYLADGINLSARTYYQQDSASMFVWVNSGATSNNALVGTFGLAPGAYIVPARASTSVMRTRLNDATSSDSGATITSPLGLSTISRLASGTYAQYRGNASLATISVASTGEPAEPFCIGRAAGGYNANRVAMTGFGAGLTATEVALLHTRMNDYLTAIGGA